MYRWLAPFVLAGAFMSQALADTPNQSDLLNLDAQASSEIPYDISIVRLAIDRDSKDPENLSAEINKILAQAFAEAKRAGVEAESGGYFVSPTYNNRGQRNGWHGRAEVILRGKDFAAVGKVAGDQADRMQMAGMNFDLSPEKRQAEENRLIEKAVANLDAKAKALLKALGYKDYSIRQITLGQGGAIVQPMPMAMMARGAVMADAAPVPVEGGKAQISVNLNAALQMRR